MGSFWHSIVYFFRLPFHIQWRTALVQLPRFVPLSVLHYTSPKGPHPFLIALPSRKGHLIYAYTFVPPAPVDLDGNGEQQRKETGEWHVPVVLDLHGGGFIMGSPLEQAPYASMMSRELGAVVLSVSYRIGPFHQFPAAIHDAEDVLSAVLDTDGASDAGRVLREEIHRYYSIVRSNALDKKKKGPIPAHIEYVKDIILDPTRLAISGFSAGGNIALNMALSVPPCPELAMSSTMGSESWAQTGGRRDTLSPILPANRRATILDDPCQSWPSLLPPPEAQPRMMPLLLFYPSLDARLLPHERPMKPMPNALKPDDHHTETPRRPGLFSILGPTYLPKKLRAHPRASPGLVDPEHMQKNAAILLVLPEKDSLAVQSDVWVDKMNSSGWNGPVRFGDGREGDWDGHGRGDVSDGGGDGSNDSNNQTGSSSSSLSSPTDPTPTTPTTIHNATKNGGLEVWHAPGCRHGWTQFPDRFVPQHERKERDLVFARTLAFVRENWARELGRPEKIRRRKGGSSSSSSSRVRGGEEHKVRPLAMPSRFTGLEE